MSVLEVNNVSIRYLTGDFKEIGLKEYTMRKLKGNYYVQEFWADKDISFALEKGDMLGIIGVNGAGKSTLLKAISGIMEPSKGYVRFEGSVAALLELASGFDSELTVRENTYLRGAMLGYTRSFMDERYNEIIDFAELREFQDRPFRQLSSGMKSRLAFSIASLVQPDLLILDEVLSVGDGAFQQKSAEKMREIIHGGATTILVSHSIDQVEELCNKVVWLHKGEQIAFGNTSEICGIYRRFLGGEVTIEEAKAMLPVQAVSKKRTVEDAKEHDMTQTDMTASAQDVSCRRKTPGERACSIGLFLFAFFLLMSYISDISPISVSGDAADIWESIKGIANGAPVGSYVMYKGMMSCYPYVWFYQLSLLFRLPEFFFIKVYHGILFAYVTTIGVPCIVKYLFKRKPKVWQIFLFCVVAFIVWKPSLALDQMIIDLPCCACFFFAVQMAVRMEEKCKGYIATVFAAGLFCGLNATASGQYSLAMICVLLFAFMQIVVRKRRDFPKRRQLFCVLTLLAAYAVPHLLNTVFMMKVVAPLIANGARIPDGNYWMERALVGLLPFVENFPFRQNPRGYAILEGVYGSAEVAAAAITAAMDTGVGWSVGEWFAAFARYPLDFLILLLDRAFMCVTVDARADNLKHLLTGYILLYIALMTMVKHTQRLKSIFQRKTLLVFASLLTIAPVVVLGVELRYAISLHSLIFGTALMGPTLSNGGASAVVTLKRLVKGELKLTKCDFPWGLLIGIFFVWVCLTHYGDLMAHTYGGIGLLFSK